MSCVFKKKKAFLFIFVFLKILYIRAGQRALRFNLATLKVATKKKRPGDSFHVLVFFLFFFVVQVSLHSGRAKVTRVTAGRYTDQPKFSRLLILRPHKSQ